MSHPKLRGLATLFLLPLLGLASSCGEGGEGGTTPEPGATGATATAGGLDLLRRQPDVLIDQPGELEPTVEAQFGKHRVRGWSAETGEDEDGTLFVTVNQTEGVLVFSAGPKRDRGLGILAWLEPEEASAEPVRYRVRVNGIQLQSDLVATGEPTMHLFEVEAPLWQVGENVLELVKADGEPRRHGDPLLAVATVLYDDPREARVEAGRLHLESGTGAIYGIEPLVSSELVLRGSVQGEGQLEVRLGELDPTTGTVAMDEVPLYIRPSKGRLEAELPLEPGAIHQVEMVWVDPEEGASSLTLERLELVEAQPVERSPIILISVDTLAARHMSVYGYAQKNTPHIERFAEDAVTFERCISNAPWTVPSYMGLLTGQYGYSHRLDVDRSGGMRPEGFDTWQVAENRWTMAEMMRAGGYRTAAFVDTVWLTDEYRFPQGFDLFDESGSQIPNEDPEGGVRLVVELAKEWVVENEEAPFFLFLQALDVHGPFLPDEPWAGEYAESDLYDRERIMFAGGAPRYFRVIPTYIAKSLVPEGESFPDRMPLAPIIQAYDEEILFLDEMLGQFFDWLDERGLYDRSTIVVTADHGESFDHDFIGHGILYEDILQIPLMIKLPNSEGGGRRVEQVVQLVDLYPTLRELAGFEEPMSQVHGRSIVPLLEGESLPSVPIFSEGGIFRQASIEVDGWKLIQFEPALESAKELMLTHPRVSDEWYAKHLPDLLERPLTPTRFKELQGLENKNQIYRSLAQELEGPYYELYYLPDDPREQLDLSAREPERVRELSLLIEQARGRREEARRNARARSTDAGFSEAEAAELEALGYADDG